MVQTSIGMLFNLNTELAENDRRLRENCDRATAQDETIGFVPLETTAAHVLFQDQSHGFTEQPLYAQLLELLRAYVERVDEFNALIAAWWEARGELRSDLTHQIRQAACRTSPSSGLLAARDALINELSKFFYIPS